MTIQPVPLSEELEGSVRCLVCDFRFGAEHIDVVGEGYSCPVCSETRLEREAAALRAEIDQLGAALADEKAMHATAYVAGYKAGKLDGEALS